MGTHLQVTRDNINRGSEEREHQGSGWQAQVPVSGKLFWGGVGWGEMGAPKNHIRSKMDEAVLN